MIKRLRFRFIIVNMSILTCVLFSILTSVFIMMYNSEVSLSYELMESIAMEENRDKFSVDNNVNENNLSNTSNLIVAKSLYNEWYENNEDREDNIYDDWLDNQRPSEYGPIPPFQHEEETNPTDDDIKEKPKETEKTEVTDDAKNVITTIIETQKNETDNSNQDSQISSNSKDFKETKPYVKEGNVTSKTTCTDNIDDSETTSKATTTEETSTKDSSENFYDYKKKEEIHDPFEGKVKRSYIFVSFKDVNELEKIVYQYCDAENDESVSKAAIEIYNSKKEHGKITIDGNKYRYLYKYDAPIMMYSITFLDRTLEISTINRLLFTFIIIAGFGLIFIFFISLILANWTIKPVSKAWDQQKQFIADASHELKTPLTVISTNTDVILSNPYETVEKQEKWLSYIKNETIRMTKLVNNLLCIAKYDANRINLVYSKLDLSNILSSIAFQYEPLIYENNKTLITDIDDNIFINGDDDKIKQLINILMDNALKYSLENGIIKISMKKIKQSSVCITISNSSENISKEQLDKIFDRFYRVDDSRNRKTGGSGLGLNIAKTIVESHKGVIRVVNKNSITSFIITLNC